MFQPKFKEKQNTHLMLIFFFLRKWCHLGDNMKKYWRTVQAIDGNMAHVHCMLDNWGYKYTLRLCNIHCFSTATMIAGTRLKLRDINIVSLVAPVFEFLTSYFNMWSGCVTVCTATRTPSSKVSKNLLPCSNYIN